MQGNWIIILLMISILYLQTFDLLSRAEIGYRCKIGRAGYPAGLAARDFVISYEESKETKRATNTHEKEIYKCDNACPCFIDNRHR